jgi:hypothetical protein
MTISGFGNKMIKIQSPSIGAVDRHRKAFFGHSLGGSGQAFWRKQQPEFSNDGGRAKAIPSTGGAA